jgi:hypothetical protein
MPASLVARMDDRLRPQAKDTPLPSRSARLVALANFEGRANKPTSADRAHGCSAYGDLDSFGARNVDTQSRVTDSA